MVAIAPAGVKMRNARARFDSSHPCYLGPRQGIVLSLLHEREVSTSGAIARACGLNQTGVYGVLRALARKGLAVNTGQLRTDLRGQPARVFTLTALGRALAKRLGKVSGLGNNYAAIRGHR